MKVWHIGLGFVVLGLSACSLIPPIDIGEDPFGLDGQSVTVSVVADDALKTQAVASTSSAASVSFDNVSLDGAPQPGSISAEFGIASSMSVSAADGSYPETITIDSVSFAGSVSEAGSTPFEATGVVAGSWVFSRDSSCGAASASCVYTAGAATLDGVVMSFTGNAMAIVFAGAEPNTASLSLTLNLSSTPELAAGSTLVVELDAGGAKAKL